MKFIIPDGDMLGEFSVLSFVDRINLAVYLIGGQVDEARRNIGQHSLEFQTHSHFGKQVGFSLSHEVIFISRPNRTVAPPFAAF